MAKRRRVPGRWVEKNSVADETLIVGRCARCETNEQVLHEVGTDCWRCRDCGELERHEILRGKVPPREARHIETTMGLLREIASAQGVDPDRCKAWTRAAAKLVRAADASGRR